MVNIMLFEIDAGYVINMSSLVKLFLKTLKTCFFPARGLTLVVRIKNSTYLGV